VFEAFLSTLSITEDQFFALMSKILDIVDSVIIIFKIWNQEIVGICIHNGLRQKKNSEVPIPFVNNSVYFHFEMYSLVPKAVEKL
jgi:hypothetical protein